MARASVAVAVAVVAGALTGCGAPSGSRPPAGPAPPTTVGPTRTVRVGLLGDRRGGAAALTRAVEEGVRLAVSQYLATASGIDVLVEVGDDRGSAAGAAAAARRLVADHVVAVIGPQASDEALGAEPVLAAAGVPTVTITATSPGLEGRWPTSFAVVADDTAQGQVAGTELTATLGARRVAVVRGSTTADQTAAAAATAAVRASGATAVPSPVLVDPGAASKLASSIVAANDDGVVVVARPGVASALVVALVAAGYAGSTVAAAGTTPPDALLRPAGADAVGVRITSAADDTSGAATVGAGPALVLRDAFRAAYGRVPPAWSAEAYDAAGFVLDGLGAGASTPAAVAAFLAGHQWSGVTGTLAFDRTGGPARPRVYTSVVTQAGTAVTTVQTGTVRVPSSTTTTSPASGA